VSIILLGSHFLAQGYYFHSKVVIVSYLTFKMRLDTFKMMFLILSKYVYLYGNLKSDKL